MCEKCIAKLLKAHTFPRGEAPPDAAEYTDWPKQAGLLCEGKFAELRQRQAERLNKTVAPPASAEESHDAVLSRWRGRDGLALSLLIAFFAAALLSYLLIDARNLCAPCAKSKSTTHTMHLSADQWFEYKKGDIHSAHEKLIVEYFNEYFSQFKNVTVTNIEAHTDPIGSSAQNDELARKRAQSVLKIFNQVKPQVAIRRDSLSGEVGPAKHDFAIWQECFIESYLGEKNHRIPKDEKPLADLSAILNLEGRTFCTKADETTGKEDGRYPACRSADLTGPKRAMRFVDLVGCLAPMRHVVITFTAEPQIESSRSKNTSALQGDK